MLDTATKAETIAVLLVEDSPTEALLIQASLDDGGDMNFEVNHVDHLAAAESALKLQCYDIVILDLTLPDSSGIDTFVKLHEHFPAIPVVILTANSSRDIGIKSVQLGAQDYILKEQIENMQLPLSLRYAIERKKAAEAIKQAHDQMEAAYRELQQAQAQLVQNEKLASIGQLAAGVAHEMNTPLGYIASNLETLQGYITKLQAMQGITDTLVEAASTHAELQSQVEDVAALRKKLKIDFVLEDAETLFYESQEGLDTLASIVQSLRDFTRIDQAEDWSDYDLEKGIESALVMVQNELKDIEVQFDKGQVPAVTCNPTQVNEALLNIIRNAIEAFDAFERPEITQIKIRTSVSPDNLVFCEIANNGPCIEEDVLPKIFDPFFTTKPVGKGTGLGLSVSYDIIVNKHHGKIHATSEVGKGTCFHIALPCLPPEEIFPADEEQVNRKEAVS